MTNVRFGLQGLLPMTITAMSVLKTIDHDISSFAVRRGLFEFMVEDGPGPFEIPKYSNIQIPCQITCGSPQQVLPPKM